MRTFHHRPSPCSAVLTATVQTSCLLWAWAGKGKGRLLVREGGWAFLHLGPGLGRTCRRVCGLGLLSDLQELMTLLLNKHTHTHNNMIKVVQRLGEVRES